ncbi:MAG: cyclase family protein [Planctomycetota bacterium]
MVTHKRSDELSEIIDITVPLHAGTPTWPGSAGVELTRTLRLEEGDFSNASRLGCDVHVGTHVDAPRHFIESGSTVEQMPLEVMVGDAFVAYLPEVTEITAGVLGGLNLPEGVERLLLRTRNSELWAEEKAEFMKDYAALTETGAQWVVERRIRLIGVDYLSVQCYGDGPLTHQILLQAGVVILEGLNLADIEPGCYELICLPLKLVDADGAPARAVLRSISEAGEGPSVSGGRS